jgi:hypothetical protein
MAKHLLKTKRLIALGVVFLLIMLVYFCLAVTGNIPCFIPGKYDVKSYSLQKNQIFNPLEGLESFDGEWEVYFQLSHYDIYEDIYDIDKLPEGVPMAMCIGTRDGRLAREMAENLNLVYTGGDAATISSMAYFIRNKELVFMAYLDGVAGYQSEEFGYAYPVEDDGISKYAKNFKKIYFPFGNLFTKKHSPANKARD